MDIEEGKKKATPNPKPSKPSGDSHRTKRRNRMKKKVLDRKKKELKKGKMLNEENFYSNFQQKLENAKSKTDNDLALYLIQILKEENKDLIRKIVKHYDQSQIIAFLEETLAIYKSGGIMIKSDRNEEIKRTFGGIFISLVKKDLKENDEPSLKVVFAKDIEKVRKRNQMKSRRRKERRRTTKMTLSEKKEIAKTENRFALLTTN